MSSMTVTQTRNTYVDAAEAVFGLPGAILELRDRVRTFVEEVVLPVEASVEGYDLAALDRITLELRAEAERRQLLFPGLLEQWQGQGFGWRIRQVVFEQVGRSPLAPGALHCAAPDAPSVDLLEAVANEDQRKRYLDAIYDSEGRSCFAMTEPAPGAGSDPSMLNTSARRQGGEWILDGTKWFISGAIGAVFAIVVAKTEQGPTLFLVSADNPGWRIVREIKSLDSYQLGGHAEIELKECVVADADRLGEVGKGLVYAQMRLEPARLGHCMRMIGSAERAMDEAIEYARSRRSFGNKLSELQSVHNMIADSRIDLDLARLATWHVVARMDAGLSVKQESAIAKVFVSEAVGRVADRAVQLFGAQGVELGRFAAFFYQNARPFRIYDGASEVHRSAIARRVLKAAGQHRNSAGSAGA